jgi:hypothetical protein
MRTNQLKNRAEYGHSLNKMNDQNYLLRKKVINIIYDLNKIVKLPRIEVRIVSGGEDLCGYAYMNANVVHMNESHMNKTYFYQVVLHEILHAVLGIEHDEKCDLMSAYVKTELTDARALELFLKYFNKVN